MSASRMKVKTARGDDGREVAQRFISLTVPRSGRDKLCFQTFDDGSGKDAALAAIRHGSLDEHFDELADLNSAGAGVFAAVNKTDGQGRRKENITRVRAVFADLDGAPLEPVKACRLKPHVIVQTSPGRYQCFWRVRGLNVDEFVPVQRAIAKRFDSDTGVALLTACARVPGFFHRKGDPHRVEIIGENDFKTYSADEIKSEFPPVDEPHAPPTSAQGKPVLSYDAPLDSAKEFVKANFLEDGIHTLRFYRGHFYRWRGTCYENVDDGHLRSKLYQYLEGALRLGPKGIFMPFNPTASRVNAVADALKALLDEDAKRQAPFWLPPAEHAKADGLIACRNGLLDLTTRNLSPHTPAFFCANALPFDFDPEAPPPEAWDRFLRELWPKDEEARRTLGEIFGLMLVPDTSFQKIFLITGPKRSGKGTIARVLTAMLGPDNVATPTLNSLSTNFGLAPLIDTRAAIISDARLGRQTNVSTVAERLLSISGEDGLQIDRKYRDHWSGKLDCRFLILTNELPRIADASGALPARFVLLMLTRSFYGKEDLGLTKKLLDECPGIMRWALAGLDRLNARGHFIMPKSSRGALRQLEDLASPVGAFIRDWCIRGANERVRVKVLFSAYAKWADMQGMRPGTAQAFGVALRASASEVRATGHGRRRNYRGIALSAEGEDQYEKAIRVG